MKLICFEGIDGSGKSTAINFASKKFKIPVIKFPTADPVLNKILKQKEKYEPKLQFLYFLSDIVKNIRNEKILLTDRYVFSTIAYQTSMGFGFEKAKKIVELIGVKKPDLVLLFDITPEEAIKRKKKQKRLDSMEKDLAFQKRVRSRFLKMYKTGFYAKKWIKINANQEKEKIKEKIKEIFSAFNY